MRLAAQVYGAAPPGVQDLLVGLYGLHLRRLRYGGEHRHILGELRESQWWPEERWKRYQLTQLQKTVRSAYRQVPLYAARGGEPTIASLADLEQLPVISKEDIRVAGPDASLRRGAKGLLEIHTGGSTGTPLTVFCDRGTLRRNYAFFARLRETAGIAEGDRVATFAGRNLVPPTARRRFWRHNWAAHTVLFSSYHLGTSTVDSYIGKLREFQPRLIDSYPSSLEPIAARMLERGDTSVRPRAIITSSETLFPEVREMLVTAFGAPVFDHYGSAEMVAFITQCQAGAYHVNTEYGIVELLRDGRPVAAGEAGEIVATGFINPVMPLIRYATGDSAVWAESKCGCGRSSPMIQRIDGRADDVIDTPDGHSVGRLDPVFKAVSTIAEARIVQDQVDHVLVEVVAPAGFPNSEREALRGELQRRLGPSMRIDFAVVAAIPRTVRGKRRTVENLLRRSAARR